MNKKQKNRKIVTQNKRNRIINRRYTSTIKTLSKLVKAQIKSYNFTEELNKKELIKQSLVKLTNSLYSIIDKAVKKKVIHKNTAARKKSKISKFSV
jgi:small subunit ribosomal protein S20